jgi:hypothetical protein
LGSTQALWVVIALLLVRSILLLRIFISLLLMRGLRIGRGAAVGIVALLILSLRRSTVALLGRLAVGIV